jgi:hypothetical protein
MDWRNMPKVVIRSSAAAGGNTLGNCMDAMLSRDIKVGTGKNSNINACR